MVKPMALIILLAIALQLTFPSLNESTLGTAGRKFAARGQYPSCLEYPFFHYSASNKTTHNQHNPCLLPSQTHQVPNSVSRTQASTAPSALQHAPPRECRRVLHYSEAWLFDLSKCFHCGVDGECQHFRRRLHRPCPFSADLSPPGPCPVCTHARAPTKTQLAADRRAAQLLEQMEVEAKRAAVAARKVERESKKRERLISVAAQKAAKASAKADDLRHALQVAAAMRHKR